MLLVSVLFSVVLYFVATVSYSIAALIAAICIDVIALPLCLIVFFYELNVMRNVGIFEIGIGTLIGALYYLIIMLIESPLKERITFGYASANIYAGIVTIIEDMLLFSIAHLCARLFKKDCIFGTILIVACVFGGYIVADTLTEMVNGLFVNETAGGLKIYINKNSADGNMRSVGRNFAFTRKKEIFKQSHRLRFVLYCSRHARSGFFGIFLRSAYGIDILSYHFRFRAVSNKTTELCRCDNELFGR